MGFLKRLLGGAGGASDDMDVSADGAPDGEGLLMASEATFDLHADRQRVSVWLRLHSAAFEDEREQQRVFELENRIMRALDDTGVGEHDTNSLEPGYFAMRLIGDDADAIVEVVEPLLGDAPSGSYLAVRHGGAGTGEDRVGVGAGASAA